jgi:hypothetical protein
MHSPCLKAWPKNTQSTQSQVLWYDNLSKPYYYSLFFPLLLRLYYIQQIKFLTKEQYSRSPEELNPDLVTNGYHHPSPKQKWLGPGRWYERVLTMHHYSPANLSMKEGSLFLVSLESSQQGGVHGLQFHDVWTCSAKVLWILNDFFTEN